MRLRQIGRPACSQIHPEECNRHDPAIHDRPRPTAPTVPRRRRQESIVTIDGVDGSVGSATFPFKRGCPFALPEEYTQLRDEGVVPLMPPAAGGHAWIVTRYEDVRSRTPARPRGPGAGTFSAGLRQHRALVRRPQPHRARALPQEPVPAQWHRARIDPRRRHGGRHLAGRQRAGHRNAVPATDRSGSHGTGG